MTEWEVVCYRVVWYAELGCIDGSIGFWIRTDHSKGFSTKKEAEKYLFDHEETVPEDRNWRPGNMRHKGSYGEIRIRRAEEKVTNITVDKEAFDKETEFMMGL